MNWTRLHAISRKEFIQIIRDPRSLAAAVVIPLGLLLLFGYAINFDVNHLSLAVYDQDCSQASRNLIGSLTQTGYFDVRYRVTDRREIAPLLDAGKVRLVLVIPPGFSRDLAANRSVVVQTFVDGSDSNTASIAVAYAEALIQSHSMRVSIEALQRHVGAGSRSIMPLDARLRIWYNPGLQSMNFIVPGVIATILMMLSALLTSMTLARERERGTIEQLIASPVGRHELMLGKISPYMLIAFADVLLVTAVGTLLFGVPLRGSLLLLFGLSALFLVSALGIGLFISTLARTQQVAMITALLTTMLPSILLSGFIFPVRSMPKILQGVSQVIPATHFLVIARGIFLKGVGLETLWPQVLILILLGVFWLSLSALRFQKRL